MYSWQSTTIGRRVDLEQEVRTIKPPLLPVDNFCPKNILFHWELEECSAGYWGKWSRNQSIHKLFLKITKRILNTLVLQICKLELTWVNDYKKLQRDYRSEFHTFPCSISITAWIYEQIKFAYTFTNTSITKPILVSQHAGSI